MVRSDRMIRAGAIASVVGAALVWSSSYAVTKEVLSEIGPLTIGAVRFSLAALLLIVILRLRRGSAPGPDRSQRRMMYLSGLLGITAYFILENIGVDMATAADASLIVATYPLMTMLLERALLRTPMPLLRVAGVLLAAAGAFLIVQNGAEVGGSDRWLGNVLLLLGGLVWAGYNILAKLAIRDQDTFSVTCYQTIAGACGFLLASLLEAPDWQIPSASGSAMLVYLAVACSIGGFLLYNHGLSHIKSSIAVNILNLVPIFGVVGAVIINGESVYTGQLVGGLIVVAGVMLGLVERGPARGGRPGSGAAERAEAADPVSRMLRRSAPD